MAATLNVPVVLVLPDPLLAEVVDALAEPVAVHNQHVEGALLEPAGLVSAEKAPGDL